MTDQTIAEEVRAAMARKQVSQASMANLLGITPSAMSRRLKGRIGFSAVQIAKIASHLEVEVSALYGEKAA